jgi:hypothetical protein
MRIKPTFSIERDGTELWRVKFCFNDVPEKYLAKSDKGTTELPDNWNMEMGGYSQWGIEWGDRMIYWPSKKDWFEGIHSKTHFDYTTCKNKEQALDLVKKTKEALDNAWKEVKRCNAL